MYDFLTKIVEIVQNVSIPPIVYYQRTLQQNVSIPPYCVLLRHNFANV